MLHNRAHWRGNVCAFRDDHLLLNDGFKCTPLRLHPNMAVVLEHLLRDVAGDVHNRLVTRSALR